MVDVAMLVLVLHPPIGVQWLTLQCWYSCYIRLSVCNHWRCNVGTRAISAYRYAVVDVAMLVLVLHPPIGMQWLTLQWWNSCFIRLSVCNGWRCNFGTRATSAYQYAMVDDVPMLVLVQHPPIDVQWLTFQCWHSCHGSISHDMDHFPPSFTVRFPLADKVNIPLVSPWRGTSALCFRKGNTYVYCIWSTQLFIYALYYLCHVLISRMK